MERESENNIFIYELRIVECDFTWIEIRQPFFGILFILYSFTRHRKMLRFSEFRMISSFCWLETYCQPKLRFLQILLRFGSVCLYLIHSFHLSRRLNWNGGKFVRSKQSASTIYLFIHLHYGWKSNGKCIWHKHTCKCNSSATAIQSVSQPLWFPL